MDDLLDGVDNTNSISTFLNELGLSQLEELFENQDIDLEVLAKLKASDLKDLGLSVGHRVRLMEAINGLHSHGLINPRTAYSAFSNSTTFEEQAERYAERRQLTVMFVDLVDSAMIAQQYDPEDFGLIVRQYQSVCENIVKTYHAQIARYFGDGILIYFGYPTAHDNDVERALLASLDMVSGIRRLNDQNKALVESPELAIRIGIATGLVVVGDSIGDHMSQEQVALGECPTLAARLQNMAKPGNIIVAESTRRLAGNAFEFTDLGLCEVKGFRATQHCWQVEFSRSKAVRDELSNPSTSHLMVGRDIELNLLISRWRSACEGNGQVVLLSGEAGIGKSRLLKAFRHYPGLNQHKALSLYCSEYHKNSALFPIVSLFAQQADIQPLEQPEKIWDKLQALFKEAGNLGGDDQALIGNLFDIPTDIHKNNLLPSERFIKQRTMEVLIEYWISLSQIHPIIIAIEDIHWADPSTLELVSALMDQGETNAIMLIATYRSEYPSPWESHPQVTRLNLTRLPTRHAKALADNIAGKSPLPSELMDTIVSRTNGVPLFIEELTKSLIDNEFANDVSYQSLLPGGQIPSTLHDSLLARLDRFNFAKQVAQYGAAFGREFSFREIKSVIELSEPELTHQLDQLVNAELLFQHDTPPNSIYRFKHALVQDTAYESLLLATRQSLHKRIAQVLADAERQTPEIVAEHFERGGENLQAAEYWLLAGTIAKKRFSLIEATRSVNRCIRLIEETDLPETDAKNNINIVKALALLGDIAGLQDDIELANKHYSQALEKNADARLKKWVSNKLHVQKTTIRNGAKLAYDVHGSGSETILLATAIIYGIGSLQPVLDLLCQEYRVITIHPRGNGRSDPVKRPYSTQDQADDLAAILEDIDAGPVVAIGLSRAANNLIKMMSQDSSRVKKLITVGCPATPRFAHGKKSDSEQSAEEIEVARNKELRREKAFAERDVETLVKMLQSNIYTEPGTEQLRQRTIELRQTLPIDTILSFFDPCPDMDVSEICKDINVPVLVSHGELDQQVSTEAATFLTNLLPQAKLHIFNQSGHIPMVTNAQEFCRIIKAFIDE